VIDFYVVGRPAPQGSKKGFSRRGSTRVQLVEVSKHVKPWREAVHAAAVEQKAIHGTLTGALEAGFTFYLPRGKTVTRLLPTTVPDLSKLIRSTEDALVTAGLIKDDSLIVRYIAPGKQYATGAPGARITIRELTHV
jgi:Holliday junction resolvase RusA-like endonuclease